MSVQKFRTFEEARRALWLPAGHPAILERLQHLGQLARIRPARRGVFRYRTIDEAKRTKRTDAEQSPDQ